MCSMPTLNRMLPGPTPAASCGRHLPMRGRSRVAGERFRVAQIHQPLEQLERVVEANAGRQAAAHIESQQRTGSSPQVFLDQPVVGAIRESRVVHGLYPRVGAQEFGHLAAVLDVAVDSKGDGLDSLQQQERIHRRQHRAQRALIDAAAPADERGGAVVFGVHEPVVGLVGLTEHGEGGGVLRPGKGAAIDHGAAERGAVAAHEFGERMNDDVGAVIHGANQHGRRHRVVDDQRHAVTMRDRCECLEVADVAGRIAHRLAEHRAGVLIDLGLDVGGTVRFCEPDLHALFGQDVSEQRVGRAVELRH